MNGGAATAGAAGLVLAALLLSACVIVPTGTPESPDQRLDRLVAEDRYGEALELIGQQMEAEPTNEDLGNRRRAVESRARQFENHRLQAAAEHRRSGHWDNADRTLAEGLALYPQSTRLAQARADLSGQRDEEMSDVERQLLVLRGRWLAESAPLYAMLAAASATDSRLRESAQQFYGDRRAAAGALHRCGQRSLSRGEITSAVECLELAATLEPNDAVRQSLERARGLREQERSKDREVRRQRQMEDRARRTAELAANCRAALRVDQLRVARDCLAELDALDPYSPEVADLRPKILSAIEQRVHRGIDAGRQHYSNGRIEQALAVWEPLLDLQPDNRELQTHVERARRVLRKLRELGG